jgi:hypothetical protein
VPRDHIITALRVADISRWCQRVEFVDPPAQPGSPWTHPVKWILKDPDTATTTSPSDFAHAMTVLGSNRFSVFIDLYRGDNLPHVGDVLIQLATFGSVVYIA